VSFAVVALTYDPPLLLSSALGLVCEKSRETAARACGQRKGDGKRGMHLPSPTPTGRFTALESARLAANAPPPPALTAGNQELRRFPDANPAATKVRRREANPDAAQISPSVRT